MSQGLSPEDLPYEQDAGLDLTLGKQVSEEGVLFRSYRDGSRVWLSPESSVAAQKALGADIVSLGRAIICYG